MAQVSLDDLNRMDAAGFAAALGDIFEHSPWVAEAAAARRPFASLVALHEAMAETVRRSDGNRQIALIRAHPDLASKAALAGELTADSTAEQASARLDQLSNEDYAAFHRLNDAYRALFDFPFVVCVRRHSKSSILRQFERRLENSPDAEREAALVEIVRIAGLRLDERVSAPDRLKVHGRLSTHVLDTFAGRPAAGVAIEFVDAADGRVIASRETNADGRPDAPLISGQPVPIGEYELRFDIGGYFARSGALLADPPFLGIVPVRFAVADPVGHYHVPLLASPWSYTTYRGS